MEIPKGKKKLTLAFGLSNSGADIDNVEKQTIDLIAKHYKFNDNTIYALEVEKFIVPKGKEFIYFDIEPYKRSELVVDRLKETKGIECK